jgi:hypothetical protein
MARRSAIAILTAIVMLFLAFLLALTSMSTEEGVIVIEKKFYLSNNVLYLLTLANFTSEINGSVKSAKICVTFEPHNCTLYYSIAFIDAQQHLNGTLCNSCCIELQTLRFKAFLSVMNVSYCQALFKLQLVVIEMRFWYLAIASLIVLGAGNTLLIYFLLTRRRD